MGIDYLSLTVLIVQYKHAVEITDVQRNKDRAAGM